MQINSNTFQSNHTINQSSTDSTGNDPKPTSAKFSLGLANTDKFKAQKGEYRSGQIVIGLNAKNVPARVIYLDKEGNRVGVSAFDAPRILEKTKLLGIDLKDLRDLGRQLDANGIGYRPYELYPGTGSDHGINFEDLIEGGLGTAYDWRIDNNLAQKGMSGAKALANNFKAASDNQVNGMLSTPAASVLPHLNIPPQPQAPALATTELLSSAQAPVVTPETLQKLTTGIESGRLRIEFDQRLQPARVIYKDTQGKSAAVSAFNAPAILDKTHQLGIPLTDLRGLGQQMDEMNVGYKPGQLYRGKGSDHGIDFENLINGGLGTAYDWRVDPLVKLKGPTALQTLQKNQEIAAKYVSTAQVLSLGQYAIGQSIQQAIENINGVNASSAIFGSFSE